MDPNSELIGALEAALSGENNKIIIFGDFPPQLFSQFDGEAVSVARKKQTFAIVSLRGHQPRLFPVVLSSTGKMCSMTVGKGRFVDLIMVMNGIIMVMAEF